jgi:hypothetical protein
MPPFTLPATVGLNSMVRVRFCDAERVTGVLPPVIEKPDPLKVIWEIVTFELPVFVMVTFCEVEVVPVVTLPKLRLVGLTPMVRMAAIPVPLSPTEVGEVGALLIIEMLPDAAPTAVGKKVTVIVVCCPALTFKGRENPLTLKTEPVSFT